MRKSSLNGGPPLPTLQILPSHRFQSRKTRRCSRRYPVGLLVVVVLFLIIRFSPNTISTSEIYDDSFLLGEDIPSVRFYDLTQATGSSRGWERNEKILVCVPLRDAAPILPLFFSHMRNLTYPHHLIDLAFLISDSSDQTSETLMHHLSTLQQSKYKFNRAMVFEKDFGQGVGQGFSDRHGFEAQAPRRKVMARARNWLLTSGLTAGYSWVYWRDADVETAPPTIIEVRTQNILTVGLDAS